MKVALIQMNVLDSKDENIKKAEKMIKEAVKKGANLVALPEMFNCPYITSNFPKYAERECGYTYLELSRIAKENSIILIGGSIPELGNENKVYNTSYIFDAEGNNIGKHRKMHLFDIDIENGQYFKESDTLSAGNEVTIFDTPYGKMGVVICYDFRFPELSRLLAENGAKCIFVPGAFNMTTGPAHWELLFRSRALDNQVYTLGVAPARDENSRYISYANSIVSDPWGKIVNRLDSKEDILIEDLNFDMVNKIRDELPLLKHLRKDVYSLNYNIDSK